MTDDNQQGILGGIEPLGILDSLTTMPPPLDFVLPGMIAGTVGSLVAQGGAGKSWLALEIAVAVAGGPDLAGMGINRGGEVLYLPAEDPRPALRQRLHALGPYLDDTARATLAENLTILPLMGHPVNVMDYGFAAELAQLAKGKRLVILDTLRRFHIEDENASGPMASLLGTLESMCQDAGTSALFLHHTAKGAALNGQGGEQQAARGSSVLVDNIRGGQWNLLGMTEAEATRQKVEAGERRNFVRLVQAKANFGPPVADRWLERKEGGILLPALHLEIAADVRRVQRTADAAQEKAPKEGRKRGRDG